MDLLQYTRRDWTRETIRDHFRAVSAISQEILNDRKQKNDKVWLMTF